MSWTSTAATWTKTWEVATAALFAACFATPIAADPSIAAPGDCAQPYRELDTGPVPPSVSSAGVAGPASSHFAPVSTTQDVVARLSGDLTGIKLQVATTLSDPTSVLDSIGEALGLVGSSTDTVQSSAETLTNGVGETGGSLVNTTAEATGTVLNGADSAGSSLLGGASSGEGTLGAPGDASGALIGGATDAGSTPTSGAGGAAGSLLQDAGSFVQSTSSALTNTTGGLLP